MKNLKVMCFTGLLAIGGIGNAYAEGEGGPFAAENFSATLTLTSDYVFRGTSFSGEEPAIQGSFDWAYGPWFAGAWGSSTDNTNQTQDFTKIAPGGELEIDLYAGWADTLGGFDLTVMPLLYTFPGQDDVGSRDDFTFELWTSIGRGLDFPGSPYVSVAFNWSPEFFDGGDSAYYIKPTVAVTLPYEFGLEFAYGYQNVGGAGGNEFFADNYEHIEVGLSRTFLGFGLDLRYHDNLDETVIGDGFASDGELVLSVSRSF